MSSRATSADIDRAAAALTATLHDLGLLHRDSRVIRTAAYGRTGAAVTGGPHYDTGAEPLIHGSTRGETLNTLRAMARLLDLSRRSHARDGWQSGPVAPTTAPDTHLDDTGD